MLSKKVRKSLKEREPMSERTTSARFKCQNTTIIQVYTPTRGGSERRLKPSASYSLQQKKMRHLIVIIAYVTAKVGSDNRNWEASMGSDQ